MSLKKNFRYPLKYKFFKKFKTIIFNRKLYKNLTIKKHIYKKKIYKIKQNLVFSNYYFPYEPFLKNYFKSELITKQKFCYFYGSIKLKMLKNKINIFKKKLKKFRKTNFFNKNLFFLELFEKRVDSILYRTYFTLNLKQVKFLVSHKNIKVNNNIIKNSFFILKKGDCITFSKKCYLILKNNLLQSFKFEFVQKNIEINFKIFHIIFLDRFKNFFYLNNLNYSDFYNLNYSLNELFRFIKTN